MKIIFRTIKIII